MQSLLLIYAKKPLLVTSCAAFRQNGRLLSTGIHRSAVEHFNSLDPLLPIYQDEKEYIATQWDLVIPKPVDFKDSFLSWKEDIIFRLESVDYALLITNGLNRTRVIFSTLKLSSSEAPTPSADKLGHINDTVNELINKKWSLIKEKLPGWQDTIANQLQRLQDYLNKKISNVDDKKSCP